MWVLPFPKIKKLFLPNIINNFNVYSIKDERLIGIGDSMELPEISVEGHTMEGAGLFGKFEQPLYDKLEPIESEIPFKIFYGDIAEFATVGAKTGFTIRAAVQGLDLINKITDCKGIKITLKGIVKSVNPGKIEKGAMMNCSCKLSTNYLNIGTSEDGKDYKNIIEIDIFKGIYTANGKDMISAVKKL